MIMLLVAALAEPNATASDAALKLCRPVLARKAEGEIATITVRSSQASRGGRTIEGSLTAFIGMGPPAPSSASAHHLIRTNFDFRCRVSGGRVRQAHLNPSRP